MDPEDLARRLRAARAYAGLRSVEALADAIDEKGLGVKTLRSIEQGTRPAYRRELAAIAEACDVPLSFLLEGPQPVSDERMDRVEQAITDLADALTQASTIATTEREDIKTLLAAQQNILDEIRRVAAGLPTDENLEALNEAARRLGGLG